MTTKQLWSGELSRKIAIRIVVEGDLILETPAHFGNGDSSEQVDMPLLVDAFDSKTPVLTGSSIAGALRSYLRTIEQGYGRALPKPSNLNAMERERQTKTVLLFGGTRADDEGKQSALIVDDALGEGGAIELRDGVKINPASRTAEENALYNLQVWQAGTKFPLRFELLAQTGNVKDLKLALATALKGFSQPDGSGITLGARKHRGYGRVSVNHWHVREYNLRNSADLIDWLTLGANPLDEKKPGVVTNTDIGKALGLQPDQSIPDHRVFFSIDATFSLDGSLLIRSGTGRDDAGPDMVHLHTRQGNADKPVLPGTSLAGALRARASKIANTLEGGRRTNSKDMINQMFGPDIKPGVKPAASRVTVEEHIVALNSDKPKGGRDDLVQNRVSIDRFTGGARDTALFNEQPVFGGDDTSVQMKIHLTNPKPHEVGLLLLLLKDLWTGDLPLGGESSVGRGRLKGKTATLHLTGQPEWKIEAQGNRLNVTPVNASATLETYVNALNNYLTEAA